MMTVMTLGALKPQRKCRVEEYIRSASEVRKAVQLTDSGQASPNKSKTKLKRINTFISTILPSPHCETMHIAARSPN